MVSGYFIGQHRYTYIRILVLLDRAGLGKGSIARFSQWRKALWNKTELESLLLCTQYIADFLQLYSKQTPEGRIDILTLSGISMNAYLICVHPFFIKLKESLTLTNFSKDL